MASLGALLTVGSARPRLYGLPLRSSALCSAWAAAMEPAPRWLAGLRFDNRALRELPVETPPPGPDGAHSAPRPVPGACFSRVRPSPLRGPRLVALSGPALALLGLDATAPEAEAEAALFFSGNALLPGAEPAAHCYCGHQFGQFAGQLGDGAAMYLGEVCTATGERWELQLKGAGPTPFSRCGARGGAPGMADMRVLGALFFLFGASLEESRGRVGRGGSVVQRDGREAAPGKYRVARESEREARVGLPGDGHGLGIQQRPLSGSCPGSPCCSPKHARDFAPSFTHDAEATSPGAGDKGSEVG
jgi:hypothetical protein